MKLSKHQKEIVKKIISEDVYDIPSYLRVFNKGKIASYDIVALRRKFNEDEQNKQYKVMKEGFSLYTKTTTVGTSVLGTPANFTVPLPRPADD